MARVLLDVALPHLDRPFDYAVPASMADDAVPGARVAVRFAGTEHHGFIAERLARSDHEGALTPLRRVVSPEPVLDADLHGLARAVADRYAGTLADVLRLAVPTRHAGAERSTPPEPPAPPDPPEPGEWADHAGGVEFLTALTEGGSPRAVWNPPPVARWPDLVARAVVATLAGNRGAVVVVPDARDVARVDTALKELIGGKHHVVLTADIGPSARYRRWLAVRRGAVGAVIGTRSAAFAPLRRPGLAVIWDDGDDLHAEPRAPYPHTRETLLLRAHRDGSAMLVGGFARTAEAEQLVTTGWARPLVPDRPVVRARAPVVRTVGDDIEVERDGAARSARLPTLAWRVARAGLARGPVLVQVPRAGYVPAAACARCRDPARCAACGGPVGLGAAGGTPACRWCATTADPWRCGRCGGDRLRAVRVGARRTAEELGRAFAGTRVVVSGGDDVKASVDASPVLVVATPGAEPVAEGGYAAALLLDGDVLLVRPELRAAEEAWRRWAGAASLVRAGPDGGEVVIMAEPSAPAVQALVRWDPGGFAARELADRTSVRLSPAARVAEITGASADVAELLDLAALPPNAEVIGPAPVDDGSTSRAIVRAPRSQGSALARALKEAAGVRSARRSGAVARVRIDPMDFG